MSPLRMLAATLALLAVSGGGAASPPKAAFPAGEREFAAMLNWLTAADAEARDRFVAEADKVGSEVQVVDATPLPTAMASATPAAPAGKAAPAAKPATAKSGS